MANRIINTEIWDDLLEVSIETRLFYIYLYTNCNHAGIIKPQKAIVSVYCGKIDIVAIEKELSDRRLIVKLTNGKLFLPQFIKANYRNLVDNNSNAAKSCIVLLQENGIDHLTLNQGFMKGSLTLIEKDKEKDKEIVKEKDTKVSKNNVLEMPIDVDPELWNKYQKVNEWIKVNAPNILKMQDQLTVYEYQKLASKMHPTELAALLTRMHNWKDISKKNVSVYHTANNWLNREQKQHKEHDTIKRDHLGRDVSRLG